MQDISTDEEVYGSDSEFVNNRNRQRYNEYEDNFNDDDDDDGAGAGDDELKSDNVSSDDDSIIMYSNEDEIEELEDNSEKDTSNSWMSNYNISKSVPSSPQTEVYDDSSSTAGSQSDSAPNEDENNHLSDILNETFSPNRDMMSFSNNNLPKEINKYCNILYDADIDFTTDLPLHLYSVYLLNTRNKNLPLPKFTLWPLQTKDLITPREYLKTTNFKTLGISANDERKELDKSRYTNVNYEENSKLFKSKSHMWEFWNPKINSTLELYECMDAIYERKINAQIVKYAKDHEYTKKHHYVSDYTYQRDEASDIELDLIFKSKIKTKLDSIIDQLTDFHTNSMKRTSKLSRKLGTFNPEKARKAKVTDFGLDWLSVFSCLNKNDKQSKLILLHLFNLKLDKDLIHGPVNSYPIDLEIYNSTKFRRDKILKDLLLKSKPKIKYPKNGANAKLTKMQKNHIRYHLDSFINLSYVTSKTKRAIALKKKFDKLNKGTIN
ncbi:hypothetical protein C6P42_004154 [Pichia californica]|nr:hypothetical protein C6P42_004154 [[Candida] californica]